MIGKGELWHTKNNDVTNTTLLTVTLAYINGTVHVHVYSLLPRNR